MKKLKEKFTAWSLGTEKGRKFRHWWINHRQKVKAIGIGTICFIVVGIICLVTWALISGYDIWAWLISKQAQAFYIFGGLSIIFFGTFFWFMAITKDK